MFCLLKNPSEQAEQRAYELWNRHSRAPSPAHKKAANTEGVFFCLLDKNKGRDSLPEIRDGTSWDGGRNTTRLLNFAKPHEERAKAIIGNQRNPKGQRIWGYWGQILSCFSPKQSVFFFLFSQNFVLLVQIRPILLFFGKKLAKVFDVTKLKKTHPWESGLPTSISSVCILKLQTLMYTQTPRYQLYPWYLIPSPFVLLGNKHQHTNTAPTTNNLQFLLK